MKYFSIKTENVSGKRKNYLWLGEMELYLKFVQNNYLIPWNNNKNTSSYMLEKSYTVIFTVKLSM